MTSDYDNALFVEAPTLPYFSNLALLPGRQRFPQFDSCASFLFVRSIDCNGWKSVEDLGGKHSRHALRVYVCVWFATLDSKRFLFLAPSLFLPHERQKQYHRVPHAFVAYRSTLIGDEYD